MLHGQWRASQSGRSPSQTGANGIIERHADKHERGELALDMRKGACAAVGGTLNARN